ncbi:MAG: hypothetical protein B6244_05770 [Candidatus Cloacimonetes bacterium 4572_55]|nr:MAG: hypothetical protein B6244_05770 [Candidatus Cloacimonetes bacterium 4572_55]
MQYHIKFALLYIFFSAIPCYAGFKLNYGVRPIGMGGAFVSVADDGTTVWWNPAGLGEREVSEFNISGAKLFNGLRSPELLSVYANSIQPFGRGIGVGAWHFHLMHTQFDQGREEVDDGYYQEGIFGMAYGLGFKYKFPISLGFSVNVPFKKLKPNDYIRNDPLFENRTSLVRYSFDVGLLLKLNEHWTYGAAIRNLNEPNMSFESARMKDQDIDSELWTKDKLPYTFQTGVSFRNDFRFWTLRAALEYSYRHRQIDGNRDESLHFGMEGWFFRGMSGLRFGSNRDELAFGFSGRVNQQSMPIQLDLSYSVPFTELESPGNNLRVALRFQFGREGGFSPEITIKSFDMSNLFASTYKYYSRSPVGYVEISNDTGNAFKNIKVGLVIHQYMDFPTEATIKKLKPYSKKVLPLYAGFNNTILSVEEDAPVQAKLTATYNIAGAQMEQSLATTFILHSRNAMNWTDPYKIGNFVTPKNSTLDQFIKQAIYPYIPENANSPYPNLSQAMQIFDTYSAYGIRYIVDPNNPYNGPSVGEEAIDYIRYPTEMLKLRSGDCDDLATLFCASVENLGISSALIDVPGHVLAMFNLGISLQSVLLMGLPADLILRWQDLDVAYMSKEDSLALDQLAEEYNWKNQVWIPVETTLFGNGSFLEAWQVGLENYRKEKGRRRVIILQDSWRKYTPATLDAQEWEPDPPAPEIVKPLLRADKKRLLQEIYGSRIERLMEQINIGDAPADAFNSLGVIYCQGGLYEDGEKYFLDALAYDEKHAGAHNNLGNIYYQENRWDDAIEHYKVSLESDPEDAGVYVNIALANYKKGDYILAKKYLKKAIEISPGYQKLYKSLWRDEE